MCLYIDRIKTEQELAKDIPERVFYKLFVRRKGCIETPYWGYRVDKPGVLTVVNPVSSTNGVWVNEGAFHARTAEGAIKQDKFYAEYFTKGEYTCVCMPIRVKKEHLVAFGGQEDVAVTAYEITKEAWETPSLKEGA